jgi:LCP family protein required for cell wall assembly
VLLWCFGASLLGFGAAVGTALYKTRGKGGSRLTNAGEYLVGRMVSPNLIFEGRDRVNVLLIGEDLPINQYQQVTKEFSRSDTNMVITLEQMTHGVGVLSLPRDTKVTVPGKGVHKLNAAHRFLGPPTLIETISANFGLPIHHYVKTNFHGFIQLVDMIGGIDVDVERDMNYDDNWQNFHVHLKKGFQHLNGQQAHGYVRWRKSNNGESDPEGDLGRIKRQQKVMKILAAKLLSPTRAYKLPAIMQAMRRYLDTDLTPMQLASLAVFVKTVEPGMMVNATLPGDYRKPFVVVRRQEAAALLRSMFGTAFDESRLMYVPTETTKSSPEPSTSKAHSVFDDDSEPVHRPKGKGKDSDVVESGWGESAGPGPGEAPPGGEAKRPGGRPAGEPKIKPSDAQPSGEPTPDTAEPLLRPEKPAKADKAPRPDKTDRAPRPDKATRPPVGPPAVPLDSEKGAG